MRRVVVVRGLRGLADGFVSVLLVRYLVSLGFTPFQIGAIVTATLLGSALLTLAVGFGARHRSAHQSLVAVSLLMMATGLAFTGITAFAPLLLVAGIGTLNPSAGDVSVFVPLEQALIAAREPADSWARVYGRYNVAGTVGAAIGALGSALPDSLAGAAGIATGTAQRAAFVVYTLTAVVILMIYRGLPDQPMTVGESPPPGGLRKARRTVLQLSALFCLDSAASGFAAQAIIILWLNIRFDLSPSTLAVMFFATGLLGGLSQLLAGRVANRIGLVRTMVFTHLPANVLLVLTAFAPTAPVAITLLLLRSLCSQMDVPARQAFVMAIVPADERTAASSITNVPRSLAGGLTPVIAGALLVETGVGWPLVIAGTAKIVYDLLLLAHFGNLLRPDERSSVNSRSVVAD